MSYKDHIREAYDVTIEITAFKVDGLPTCMSWFGDKANERESCEYLLFRKMGIVPVCGAVGEDLHEHSGQTLIKPCNRCPIHTPTKELKG